MPSIKIGNSLIYNFQLHDLLEISKLLNIDDIMLHTITDFSIIISIFPSICSIFLLSYPLMLSIRKIKIISTICIFYHTASNLWKLFLILRVKTLRLNHYFMINFIFTSTPVYCWREMLYFFIVKHWRPSHFLLRLESLFFVTFFTTLASESWISTFFLHYAPCVGLEWS